MLFKKRSLTFVRDDSVSVISSGVKIHRMGSRGCDDLGWAKCQNRREGANEKVLKSCEKRLKSEKFRRKVLKSGVVLGWF